MFLELVSIICDASNALLSNALLASLIMDSNALLASLIIPIPLTTFSVTSNYFQTSNQIKITHQSHCALHFFTGSTIGVENDGVVCVSVCLYVCRSVCSCESACEAKISKDCNLSEASVDLDSPESAPPVVISSGISRGVLRACACVELRPVIAP